MLKNLLKMYCVVPVNLAGIYAFFFIYSTGNSIWWLLFSILGFICMMMCGVAACYHRLLSHRGYVVNRPIKIVLLWFAAISGQGSPIFWASVHRGYHHAYTDTDKDPHSPVNGFWHSYILWMLKIDYKKLNLKSVPDLLKDSDILFFHKNYFFIFFGSHLLLASLNFEIWVYFGAIGAFLTFHANCFNTSLNHYKFMGYKNYNLSDNSINSIWLFPFIQGEAWHNNHHNDPKNINYGGRQWWEFDPTYYIVKLLKNKN